MKINPKVVDLSHYDNVVDGFKSAYTFGIRGVINKVTEGPGMVDKSFDWRRQPAKQAGMLYAAYHFLRPGNIEQQVENFLGHAKPDDKLGLALDHEDKKVPLDAAQEFMELVNKKLGRYPSLYSGFLIKEQLGNTKSKFWKNIRLWLCQYSSKPNWPVCWDEPWLWQYTGDGVGLIPHNVPGIIISGGLDVNSFNGTDEELSKSWV